MIRLRCLEGKTCIEKPKTTPCEKKISCNIFLFVFLLIASMFVFFPLNGHAYSYSLYNPDTSVSSPVEVVVEITPDIAKSWACTTSDSNGMTLNHHLVTFSTDQPVLQIQVTAVYTGTPEGSITFFNPPGTPNGFTNNWVEGTAPFSYSLTIPLEDIQPDNTLWLVSSLGYKQRIQTGTDVDGQPVYSWVRSSSSISDELILSRQLVISANMNLFSQQLGVAVFEPTGLNVQCGMVGELTDSLILIGDRGAYSISFDKKDEDNVYNYYISASLDSDFDTDGYFRDKIKILAFKDGVAGQLDYSPPLAYAIVAETTGTTRLLSREDVLMEPRPVVQGEVLFPGDTIEVVSGNFHIKFCNGESAVISGDDQVTRIVLGSDGITSARSSMSLLVDNLTYDIQNDPRRYLRLAVYSGLGYGTSSLFPGASWLFRTAVSQGVKYGFKRLCEPQYKHLLTKKSTQTVEKGISSSPQQFYTVISLFPDGKIMFNPIRGQAQLDFGSSQKVLAEGSRTMGDMTAVDPQITTFGSEGYNLEQVYGLSAHWFGDGSEIHTRTPTLSLGIELRPYTFDSPVNPDYLEVRLNGQLVSDARIDPISRTVNNIVVTPSGAFQAGNNKLEAFLTEDNRPFRHRIEGNLFVADDAFATPPSKVSAYSSTTQATVVRWEMQDYPDIEGYNIERGVSESGPFYQLNQEPYSQEVWLDDWKDESPTAPYWYRVQVVYHNGLASNWSDPVQQEDAQRHSTLGTFASSGNARIQSTPQGLQILFDDNWPRTVFWKIERGLSSSGPWQDLLHDQYLVRSGYQDGDVTSGTDYWYRLSIYDILDDTSAAVIMGPASWDGRPGPPTGLTCVVEDGTALLRWDTVDTGAVAGFRVYRSSGSGFKLVSNLPATTSVYYDRVPQTGNYLWMIKSVTTDGLESLEGAQSPGYRWVSTKCSGTINLGSPTMQEQNGERVVTIPVYRTQGSSGAMLVTVAMNLESDNGLETVSKYVGTALFDDGESSTFLTTSIDAGYHLIEGNSFTLYNIFGINSGSCSGFPWPMFLPALTGRPL